MESTSIITDPWATLGADRTDDAESLRRARNALALENHPDKCPSPSLQPQWTARMAIINDAFALATDPEAWATYKRHNHIASVDDDDDDTQPQHAPEESARAAAARAHAASNDSSSQASARAQRRENIQRRADDLRAQVAEDPLSCAPGAAERWAGYFAQQMATSASDDPVERVEAREKRDAERIAEEKTFGVRAALGMAVGEDADAAALLVENGGSWSAEELVGESLGHLEEAEEGSHKRRKAARRMLVGEAVERTAQGRLRWDQEHGGAGAGAGAKTLGGGPDKLRIGHGPATQADEEMEALEEDRRRQAQKLEQYAETRRFRSQWDGRLGNETPVRKPARPPNRKEARQMKKLMSQGKA